MPSSNAIPGPRQAHEACDSGVWGSVLPCDIVTAKVSPFFFFLIHLLSPLNRCQNF